MSRLLSAFAALFLLLLPQLAAAQVMLSFHSFNGSVLVGRYPHTFIVLEGSLDETGQVVNENYGYTAVSASPAVLAGNVAATVNSEKQKYIGTTNRHFTVPLSDAQYHAVVAEVRAWRDAPGKTYNLDRHNCVHFVARIAEMVGLRADVPENMVRRPKAWLNYVTRMNPQLGAREIK
jgi:hypothetical protein